MPLTPPTIISDKDGPWMSVDAIHVVRKRFAATLDTVERQQRALKRQQRQIDRLRKLVKGG